MPRYKLRTLLILLAILPPLLWIGWGKYQAWKAEQVRREQARQFARQRFQEQLAATRASLAAMQAKRAARNAEFATKMAALEAEREAIQAAREAKDAAERAAQQARAEARRAAARAAVESEYAAEAERRLLLDPPPVTVPEEP